MGAVLLTLTALAVALEALLVALLFIPVNYTVSARTGAGVRFRVRWLFGLVRVDGGGGRPRREPRPRRERSRGVGPPVRRLMAIEGLIPRAATLVRELIRSLGWRRGRIAVRAGTGDPAGTGEICGLVGPLLLWRPWPPSLQVEFEPDFEDLAFEAEAKGSGRLVPLRVVGAIGRFAFSRQGLQAVKVFVWNSGR